VSFRYAQKLWRWPGGTDLAGAENVIEGVLDWSRAHKDARSHAAYGRQTWLLAKDVLALK
jgi:hypothetical protein